MFSKIFKFLFGRHEARKEPVVHSDEVLFAAGEFSVGKYPEDWPIRQREVLNRDKSHCQVTGCINCASWGDSPLHVHHKTAISEGGLHELWNLITLCEFHHGLLHLPNRLLREEIRSARFSLVSPYWRMGHPVRAAVRRFQLVTGQELRIAREHYGLHCAVCGSINWQGNFVTEWRGFSDPRHRLVETRCLDCNDRWLFDRGLAEETGFQLASVFKVTRNKGQFDLDPGLIVGLESPKHFEGCPICPQAGRTGYLLRKEGQHGPFLGCSEWRRGEGCNYTRNLRA